MNGAMKESSISILSETPRAQPHALCCAAVGYKHSARGYCISRLYMHVAASQLRRYELVGITR